MIKRKINMFGHESKSFRSLFILIVLILFVALTVYLKIREKVLPTAQIMIAGKTLTVELAQTPFVWAKGLSGRDSLAEDRGMLFVFPNVDRHSFWMKDMKFSIDIIWINEGKVIDIAPNLQPNLDNPLPSYLPRLPVKFVLEVKAGFSEKNGLKIGDGVKVLTK